MLERYIALKQGVRHATKVGYNFVLNLVKKEDFGFRKINTIKPAFQMACDEDIIRKNPFTFSLAGVVVNDAKKRVALTPQQQEIFMSFIRNDSHYCRYYDEFNVLLGTGMRVSEFCGLTKDDLDFKNRRIFVEKQLIKERNGTYSVEKTKTESGVRYIPMTDSVYENLQYLMGHSDAAITMNVYTHASYERAAEAIQKILQFKAPEVKRTTG